MPSNFYDIYDIKVSLSKIVHTMIKQNKPQNYIMKTLKELAIYEFTTKSFDKFTSENLHYKWDRINDKWIETSFSMFSNDFYSNVLNSSNVHELVDMPQSNFNRIIRIPSGINIPKLQALELACTTLNEGEKISVSTNDAETLLKNMAAIQSKLNEIVGVLNKISSVLSTNEI